ncbi:hypothetical protein SNEBB_009829 [Seison nebaliae]|nr:hypothetical protein SNEBB_009829 [Seison nebaliae]
MELFATDDGITKDVINKFLPRKQIKEEGFWVKCEVERDPVFFRVCSGTSKTFISTELVKMLKYKPSNCDETDIILPNAMLSTNQILQVSFKIGNECFRHSLLVVDCKLPHQVLGVDLISKLGLILDFHEQKIFKKKNKEIIKIEDLMTFNELTNELEKNMENELEEFQEPEEIDIHGQEIWSDNPPLPPVDYVENSFGNVPESIIGKIVDNMLTEGIIEEVEQGDFLSPLMVEEKSDGKLRIFVDYTKLNEQVKRRKFESIFGKRPDQTDFLIFSKANYFSTIRISECHLVPIVEERRHVTTFKFGPEYYQFIKMPFGLETYQSELMIYLKEMLSNLIGDCCALNENCLFIYSSELNEHQEHLRQIVAYLNEAGIFVDFEKCELFRKEVYYKDYVVSNRGLEICPTRLENMINLTNPSSEFDIRMLLYYFKKESKFFENYWDMTKEIKKCLQNNCIPTILPILKRTLLMGPNLSYYSLSRRTILTINIVNESNNNTMLKAKLTQQDTSSKIYTIGYFSCELEQEFHLIMKQRFQAYFCFKKAIEAFQHQIEGKFSIIVLPENSFLAAHCNHDYRQGSKKYKKWNDFFRCFDFQFST